jgi:hypothetical protein
VIVIVVIVIVVPFRFVPDISAAPPLYAQHGHMMQQEDMPKMGNA